MIASATPPAPFFTVVTAAEGNVLLATGASGVVRSDDGGWTWQPISTQLGGLAESLAVAPPTADSGPIMLAGGAEGVWRSSDDGRSWTITLTGSPVFALELATDRTGALIALAGTATDGILRSGDGGRSWASANAGLFALEIIALTVSPAFREDNTAFAGTTSGLYRSRNGGKAWRLLETPGGEVVVQCVAVAPAFCAIGTVLAGTEDSGLPRSVDGGESWGSVDDLKSLGVVSLVWSETTRVVVIASTARGMARSDDAGATWRIVDDSGPALSLAVIRDSAGELVLASLAEGGPRVSSDHGQSWQEREVSVTDIL